MKGSPFTRSRRNAPLPGPRPNGSKELSIEAGAAQVMQKTGDVIEPDSIAWMSQAIGHGHTHPGRSHGMWPIIAADCPAGSAGMRDIVQFHESLRKRAGDFEAARIRDGHSSHRRQTTTRISSVERVCQGDIEGIGSPNRADFAMLTTARTGES